MVIPSNIRILNLITLYVNSSSFSKIAINGNGIILAQDADENGRSSKAPYVGYATFGYSGDILDLTYRYKGLPPGPIASPGLKSIIAALYPAKTRNLYFVSRQDGSHQFSATLNEHNRAVQKYQLRKVGR